MNSPGSKANGMISCSREITPGASLSIKFPVSLSRGHSSMAVHFDLNDSISL